MAKTKKKTKRQKMIFCESANCATINVLGMPGTIVYVGRKTIKLKDIVYEKPIEIDIFVRNGKIVPYSSDEGKQARQVAYERDVVNGGDPKMRGKEIVRGMEIERQEDYVEKPLPKKVDDRKGRVENISDKELAEIKSDEKVTGTVDSLVTEARDERGLVIENRDTGKPFKSIAAKPSSKEAVFIPAKPGAMKKGQHKPLVETTVKRPERHDDVKKEVDATVKETPDIDKDLIGVEVVVEPDKAVEEREKLPDEIKELVGEPSKAKKKSSKKVSKKKTSRRKSKKV